MFTDKCNNCFELKTENTNSLEAFTDESQYSKIYRFGLKDVFKKIK